MKNREKERIKKVGFKHRTCNFFNDVNKIEDFNFDNILLNEKLCVKILIYDVL